LKIFIKKKTTTNGTQNVTRKLVSYRRIQIK